MATEGQSDALVVDISGASVATSAFAQGATEIIAVTVAGMNASLTMSFIGIVDSVLFNTALAMNPFEALAVNANQALAVELGDSWVGKTAARVV